MQPMNPNPGLDGDPYEDPMLHELEASIEQHTPLGPYETDPLHNMLDGVEDSIGQIPPTPAAWPVEPVHDPLWDILDKLEADTESQVIPPEASGFEPPPEPDPEAFGLFESEPPLPDDGERFMREYLLPPGLSKGGQGTGSKCLNCGGTSMGWCQLHSKLVSFVDCEECDDNFGDSGCEHWSDA